MKTNIDIINGNRIGGNITVISYGTKKIVIDFGEALPGSDVSDDIPFDWENENVSAVFFTHYHGDHIGRFPEIPIRIPVYMGEATYFILLNLSIALKRQGDINLLKDGLASGRIHFIEQGQRISIGETAHIRVTGFTVDHSAFDAFMFLIETGDTRILHTGDFRDHGHRGKTKKRGTDRNVILDVIRSYIVSDKNPVDILITEGTMIGIRSQDLRYSEKDMLKEATEYFKEHRYIFIKVSSTNADSIASFCQAAKKNNLPFYASRYVLSQLRIFSRIGRKHQTNLYDFSSVKPLPDFSYALSVTNSSQPVSDTVENMKKTGFVILVPGDISFESVMNLFSDCSPVLIYSMWKGYITEGNKAYNKSLADFCSHYEMKDMHTSGHAFPELIAEVINTVNPRKKIIPIHTESAGSFLKLPINDNLKRLIQMNNNYEIRNRICSCTGNNNIKLPGNIDFQIVSGNTIRIVLHSDAILKKQMYDDSNAFEGWASSLIAFMKNKNPDSSGIILDTDTSLPFVPGRLQYNPDKLNRFLYRALRFSQQYSSWFSLSEQLKETVSLFETDLKNTVLTNNIPGRNAGVNNNKELLAELRFASEENLLHSVVNLNNNIEFGHNPVYRQLPVGLFANNHVSEENAVFSRGRACIDLWSWNDSTFEIAELKKENPMIGIVSELFFYCNYMLDLLSPSGLFKLNTTKPGGRGYKNLRHAYSGIYGFFLADAFHPLLDFSRNDYNILNILNDNGNTPITYFKTKYDF